MVRVQGLEKTCLADRHSVSYLLTTVYYDTYAGAAFSLIRCYAYAAQLLELAPPTLLV